MKRFLIALQFLTIIPVRKGITVSEAEIAKSSSVFVLVGVIQGILLIATDYIAGRVFHPDLATGIILLVYVLSNGGFHLDGLADTFDAIAAKAEGSTDADQQKRLSILKDTATGPIGVTAILFSLGLKYLSLTNLTHFLPFTYYSSLFFLPVISKWTMLISMFHGKPARENGLGNLFIKKIGVNEVALSTAILSLLFILPKFLFSYYIPDNQYIFYALLLVTMYLLCRVWILFFHKKFGGLTGDMLGAVSEITEVIFLLMVVLWSRFSI
jgi:adenosylcobinamide-GDP ribazoletransferase